MTALDKLKMLRVDDDVHKMISQEGKYGDSMNDILKRLLEELYEFRKMKGKK
jgi:negative regulator of replication initiation